MLIAMLIAARVQSGRAGPERFELVTLLNGT
jgi:hypothetical protein